MDELWSVYEGLAVLISTLYLFQDAHEERK